MAKMKFVLDSNGVRSLLQGAEMQGILRQLGSQKAAQAGDGYVSDVHMFTKRAVAHVYADTREAKQDNYDNNTLLKVVKG